MTKMKKKILLGLIEDMISNGNKHLSTFESSIIHYPIFNIKKLNLIKKISFKVFNYVLGKESKK